MGRAMVREPAVYLMDEPLSNLDAKLRIQMRAEISRITRRTGVTTVYVTHDQTEAMTLGDRVAVMRKGVLQQVDAPQELYDDPVNMFVAGFIGSPPMNLVEGVFSDDQGALRLRAAASRSCPSTRLCCTPGRPCAGIWGGGWWSACARRTSATRHWTGPVPRRSCSPRWTSPRRWARDLYVHFSLPVPAVVSEDTRELARDAGAEPQREQADRTMLVARCSPALRGSVR